ncbi:uncharacterized protein LY89DRAFT_690686 [Mollisia scopiformis]|uniref:Uncharacterized protein n=1 Tax=Mollisia scopiformis TaxID=149040 RepID=A0A132B9X4_MOLSC|nr:uncharacterized protein LY89DRAFT_690686 [Mollisia scopiformis]KUJ09181.1 hypothetical protein LY89DRAFT_690686 [Mollisia scopiformis]
MREVTPILCFELHTVSPLALFLPLYLIQILNSAIDHKIQYIPAYHSIDQPAVHERLPACLPISVRHG